MLSTIGHLLVDILEAFVQKGDATDMRKREVGTLASGVD